MRNKEHARSFIYAALWNALMRYKNVVVLDSVIFFPEHRRRLALIADNVVEYNTTTDEQVNERCVGADCVISCWVNIPNSVIDANPQLRTIAFWTHDFEHRIDWQYARQRGVHVPAIPDYGTDSVAELVFVALLQLSTLNDLPSDAVQMLGEEVVARFSNDARGFSKNVKDTLGGRWLHEYVKTGQLKIAGEEQIQEETLKGLTLGILDPNCLATDLPRIAALGFRMNVIYSLADYPHTLHTAYRPIDKLLSESQIIVYDSRQLPEEVKISIERYRYLSRVDVAGLTCARTSLRGRTLGIIGLGRIGSRVAQIATDGFGLKVHYYSRTRKPELEMRYGLAYAGLSKVLSESDILSFHLPHHGADDFVSDLMLRSIPKGTVVVNASVGNVIGSEHVLLNRFATGELRGYLDVYRGLPPRSALRASQGQLYATYRLGWRTKSTVGLKTHKLISKIAEVL